MAGTPRPDSDHDVAVLFAGEPAPVATEPLAADLAARLGTGVDVVDLGRAGLELRGRVAESGRLLFSADEVARVRFEVDAPDQFRRRHLVQTAAQICIDLADHVIAADGHRTPRDDGDAFRVLAEVGVLDDGLAGRMVALAG
ncbi:HepT-like ribonuclease domain-containing protein [Pseudonocardia alni]|uniref:HepT-like ribonuclease domain-containing protein n=1 Tax=Pseudonocardia alni TaxID=33907 RepID=UPI00248362E6